jgi:hypothetical protein
VQALRPLGGEENSNVLSACLGGKMAKKVEVMDRVGKCVLAAVALLAMPASLTAAEDLRMSPSVDYMKNGVQGPLILGDHMDDVVEQGVPNFIFIYAEFCYNAKRQALRTVELYKDYKQSVHFVVMDLSQPLTPAQIDLFKKYLSASFPHIIILDRLGKPVFDYIGETPAATLIGWLDSSLRSPDSLAQEQQPPTSKSRPGSARP